MMANFNISYQLAVFMVLYAHNKRLHNVINYQRAPFARASMPRALS